MFDASDDPRFGSDLPFDDHEFSPETGGPEIGGPDNGSSHSASEYWDAVSWGQVLGDEVSQLESLIREAGDFVVPSLDHRPQVLEQAKQHADAQHRRSQAVTWLGAALLLLASIPLSITMTRELAGRLSGPSSDQLLALAVRISDQTGCGPDWGLVEAFRQLRSPDNEQPIGSGAYAISQTDETRKATRRFK